jgi:hypothetical protein
MKIIEKSGRIFYSGSVGDIIGYIKNGKQYFRTKPEHINDAKSKKQVNQRTRFSACNRLAKSALNDILKPVWKKAAITMTGFNLFVKTNLSVFDETGKISNYSNLKFSVGNLPLPENIVITNAVAGNGAINIIWTDNSGVNHAAATDRLRVVALKVNKPVVITGLNFIRNAQLATVQLPYVAGDAVHVYAFFQDEKGNNFSDSFHALVNIPA